MNLKNLYPRLVPSPRLLPHSDTTHTENFVTLALPPELRHHRPCLAAALRFASIHRPPCYRRPPPTGPPPMFLHHCRPAPIVVARPPSIVLRRRRPTPCRRQRADHRCRRPTLLPARAGHWCRPVCPRITSRPRQPSPAALAGTEVIFFVFL
jgi:hypothetical protein